MWWREGSLRSELPCGPGVGQRCTPLLCCAVGDEDKTCTIKKYIYGVMLLLLAFLDIDFEADLQKSTTSSGGHF
jgi:hypothetical protein